jgi:UDP-2,3-diacylglucosamine hydrolase
MADSAASAGQMPAPGPLGIVAGGGTLPRRVVESCRLAGRDVFVLALEGAADPATVEAVPHAWCRIGAAATGLDLLRARGIGELVLAGGIHRPSLAALRPDWRAAKFFARVGYRALGDDGLLSAVVKELELEGFRVIGADQLLGDAELPEGPLGRIAPDDDARADIARGMRLARAIGALDIGQAVVVQQGLVLGVEAIDGTDALLRRCAGLRRDGPGGVLVKAEKPGQESRADRPTIGPQTVALAAQCGLRGIAAQAGATLVIDRAEIIRRADSAGLFVVGIRAE